MQEERMMNDEKNCSFHRIYMIRRETCDRVLIRTFEEGPSAPVAFVLAGCST
jgi:hypothetical protein